MSPAPFHHRRDRVVVALVTAIAVVAIALAVTTTRGIGTEPDTAAEIPAAVTDAETALGEPSDPPPTPSPPADDAPPSDDDEPSNRAPVIEAIDATSTSLDLVVRPRVVDPDGDDVRLVVRFDGEEANQSPDFAYRRAFTRDEVGKLHRVDIEVVATDARGAVSTEEARHQLVAVDRVTVSPIVLRRSPQGCPTAFGVQANVRYFGPVASEDRLVARSLTPTEPRVELTGQVSEDVPATERERQYVRADFEALGERFGHVTGHLESAFSSKTFRVSGSCELTVSWSVTIEEI